MTIELLSGDSMCTWDELAAALSKNYSVRDASDGWLQVSFAWDNGRQQIADVTQAMMGDEPIALITSPLVTHTDANAVWMLSNVDVPLQSTEDGMISFTQSLVLKDLDVNLGLKMVKMVAEIADRIENSITDGHDAHIPLRGEEVAEPTQQTTSVIPAGQWIVGRDLQPGLYRFSGYVARLDSNMNIINNESARSGLGLILVSPHDSYFEVSGEAVSLENLPDFDALGRDVRDGTYLVGTDIPVGRYRIHGEGRSAYYALYDRNLTRITNDFNRGSLILDLQSSAFAVGISGRLEPIN